MQAIGFATTERLHALPKDQDVRAIACQLCPLGHDLQACLRAQSCPIFKMLLQNSSKYGAKLASATF